MKRRILAIVLCLTMVLTSGIFAFAETETVAPVAETEQITEEVCAECGQVEVHLDTCSTVTDVEVEGGDVPVTDPVEGVDPESNFVKPVYFDNAAKIIKTMAVNTKAKFMLKSSKATDDSKPVVNKTVKENGDGSYKLTLESYVTGSSETITEVTKIPSDIVLVLDESGSMDNCIKCNLQACKNKNHYQKIYANKMDPAKVSTYYYKKDDDDTYYKASYCEECDKWLQQTNGHASGNHNSGSQRIPKESAEDTATNHYQYYYYCEHEERYESLRTAVNTFLESVYEDAAGDDGRVGTNDDVTHRIAIVGFGDKGHLRTYVTGANANTGDLGTTWKGETEDTTGESGSDADGENGYLHKSDWATGDYPRYLRLLRWANNTKDQGHLASAMAAIGLDNGSTYTELGLDAARAIFDYCNPVFTGTKNPTAPADTDDGRNRVVIMFTDGAPTHNSAYFSNANTAISYANDLKNDYNASVYTVGIFSGADASNPGTLPTYYNYSSGNLYPDSTNATNSAKGIKLANRFMHLVSSNYPNATAMEDDKTGALNSNLSEDGYYLSAGDADELAEVFQRIYDQIESGGANSKLSSTAVVKDIVTDSFEIPEGASSVTAYSMTYGGKDSKGKDLWTRESDDINYTATVNGKTVTVSGFDFSGHYVGMDSLTDKDGNVTYTPHGKKLVLEVEIEPVEGFLGGDDIATNTEQSGIYESVNDTTPEARFPVPTVDIDVEGIAPESKNGQVYLSQSAEIPHLIGIGKYWIDVNGDTEVTDDEWFEVDGINNGYVDVVYTLSTEAGESMTYTIPAGTAMSELYNSETATYDFDNEESWLKSNEELQMKSVITEDKTFAVECGVISINNRDENKEMLPGNPAKISVYKPVITFADSTINLGETANYADNQVLYDADEDAKYAGYGTNVKWVHPTEGRAEVSEMGAAPELEFSYDPATDGDLAFKKDTPVTVTSVMASGVEGMKHEVPASMDVLDYATFYRGECSFETCEFEGPAEVDMEQGEPNFVVHLNSFDLHITKSGANVALDENQTFVFRVTKANSNFSMDVAVVGNDTAIIKGLPVGEYTVTELTDWSWRYELAQPAVTVSTSGTEDGIMRTSFANNRPNIYWLDGNAYKMNFFSGFDYTSGQSN